MRKIKKISAKVDCVSGTCLFFYMGTGTGKTLAFPVITREVFMKKKHGITVILAAAVIGLSTYIMTLRDTTPVISAKEAEKIMQNYCMDSLQGGQWEEESILGRLADTEVSDSEAYSFEIRFKESGRLIASYAVTVDGSAIFRYNPADDVWVMQE